MNVTIALAVLGIPPILTNSFVGISQVDRTAVEAAKGMGMTGWEVVRKVELPLAVPTIFTGLRTAAINIIATATIATLAGETTLGDFIINRNVFGDAGRPRRRDPGGHTRDHRRAGVVGPPAPADPPRARAPAGRGGPGLDEQLAGVPNGCAPRRPRTRSA